MTNKWLYFTWNNKQLNIFINVRDKTKKYCSYELYIGTCQKLQDYEIDSLRLYLEHEGFVE